MKRYWLESYGCQMNMAESNALQTRLEAAGLVAADSLEASDIAIINTCSVRKSAEDRIWGRLGYFDHVKKTNKDLKIVVTGCMAQRLLDDLKKNARRSITSFPSTTRGKSSISQPAAFSITTLSIVLMNARTRMGKFQVSFPS